MRHHCSSILIGELKSGEETNDQGGKQDDGLNRVELCDLKIPG